MFRAVDRQRRCAIFGGKTGQGLAVIRDHRPVDPLLEFDRPFGPGAHGAEVFAQIVNHVAARYQQYAFVAQGRKPGCDFEVPFGRQRAIEAELDHRNVGRRIHRADHAP